MLRHFRRLLYLGICALPCLYWVHYDRAFATINAFAHINLPQEGMDNAIALSAGCDRAIVLLENHQVRLYIDPQGNITRVYDPIPSAHSFYLGPGEDSPILIRFSSLHFTYPTVRFPSLFGGGLGITTADSYTGTVKVYATAPKRAWLVLKQSVVNSRDAAWWGNHVAVDPCGQFLAISNNNHRNETIWLFRAGSRSEITTPGRGK